MFDDIKVATKQNVIDACSGLTESFFTQYDSYMYSPVYILFTGRNGVWVKQNNRVYDFILSHPNKDNAYIVLPAFEIHSGRIFPKMSQDILCNIVEKNPDTDISLGRFPEQEQPLVDKDVFLLVSENVLDWKYPTRILSTEAVYNLRGKNFQQVRQRLNQLNKNCLKTENINLNKDRQEILNVIYNWANQYGTSKYTYDDLIEPSKFLLDLMNDKDLKLYGQKILYKGEIKSFCIYEIVNNFIANEFAISADRLIPGLSEFQIYEMCKQLYNNGIKYINLGGSETLGLDRFKKKFAPIMSYNLQTYKIRHK